jgi:hypothetical protein
MKSFFLMIGLMPNHTSQTLRVEVDGANAARSTRSAIDGRLSAADTRWMRYVRKLKAVAATLALAVGLVSQPAFAQLMAPGGPIGNSLGIGSGLGGVIRGTGPSYPNNSTTQLTPPTPPPPGGGLAPMGPPPTIFTARPPSYPNPLYR